MSGSAFARSALFPLIVIAALIWLGVNTLRDDSTSGEKLRFSQALTLVRSGPVAIERVTFDPETHEVELRLATGRRETTVYPVEQSAYELQQLLEEKGIPFQAKRAGGSAWSSLLTSLLPFVLLLAFWLLLMRTVRRDPSTAPDSQETQWPKR